MLTVSIKIGDTPYTFRVENSKAADECMARLFVEHLDEIKEYVKSIHPGYGLLDEETLDELRLLIQKINNTGQYIGPLWDAYNYHLGCNNKFHKYNSDADTMLQRAIDNGPIRSYFMRCYYPYSLEPDNI